MFYTEENRRFFVYRVGVAKLRLFLIFVNGDNSNLIHGGVRNTQ